MNGIDNMKPSLDLNMDHSFTNKSVMTSCRTIPGYSAHSKYCYEIPSSIDWEDSGTFNCFNPVHFVDITQFIKIKLLALECYADEMRAFPHARSMEAVKVLSKFPGAQSGLMEAETFTVNRQVRPAIK